jgi:transposase-like protein
MFAIMMIRICVRVGCSAMSLFWSDLAGVNFSEDDCIAYFYSLKWPNGFHCPKCGHSQAYTIRTRRLPLYQCFHCRHQTTLTAGTIMDGTRTPLHKWRIAFHLVSEAAGVNAVQLSQLISVTYKTAWLMLHRIRHAISLKDQSQPLCGKVRGGLGYYRERFSLPFYRHPKELPVVAAAAFRNGAPVYVKLKTVPEEWLGIRRRSFLPSRERLFWNQHVSSGTSDIRILEGVWLHSTPLSGILNQAKTWIARTFHGIGIKYLQNYWDEFCFKLNQRYRQEPAADALCRICMCIPEWKRTRAGSRSSTSAEAFAAAS